TFIYIQILSYINIFTTSLPAPFPPTFESLMIFGIFFISSTAFGGQAYSPTHWSNSLQFKSSPI
ncbi:hypothetical protein ACN5PC_11175, partial [Aliarcobacter butzleri]|uniref:hypothetical protein n=1 Tax=Aliarcobacter butzleri TaxID=28197 RepID=UPI003AF81320